MGSITIPGNIFYVEKLLNNQTIKYEDKQDNTHKTNGIV